MGQWDNESVAEDNEEELEEARKKVAEEANLNTSAKQEEKK